MLRLPYRLRRYWTTPNIWRFVIAFCLLTLLVNGKRPDFSGVDGGGDFGVASVALLCLAARFTRRIDSEGRTLRGERQAKFDEKLKPRHRPK